MAKTPTPKPPARPAAKAAPKPAAKPTAKPSVESSPKMSTLAAKIMNGKKATREETVSLAAVVLRNDQTPGQKPKGR